ncbi:hypothetical protein NsoK4_08830 [Nitrosopumilus sp. K4]|uniref:hypothetical protein n=1 Tax=Nitrosopumilus sp. K4 TaxID=2795383 RepID=UPI001BAB72EA|nr:hypothetical protein [Nitrosopumilus sp. K4]QUC64511.1 hypothetical protein NsoK4_08830 [Nitrosopumilus sp. K4]
MDNRIAIMSVIAGVAFVGGIFVMSALQTESPTANALLGLKGHVTLTVYDENGNIKQYVQGDNSILNDGHNCIIEDILHTEMTNCAGTAGSNSVFNQVAIGTSGTASTQSQTGLLAGTGDTKIGTVGNTVSASGATGASADVVATFTDPGVATYREAILLNSDSDILARNTYTAAPLTTATDDLVITWTITSD